MGIKPNEKWSETIAGLSEKYPRLKDLNWNDILREDPQVFQGIVGGMVKPKKGKMSLADGDTKLARLNDEDYSDFDFHITLQGLCKNYTVRHAARKIGFSPSKMYKLQQGNQPPSMSDMEQIADAMNRKPSLFKEYRMNKVFAHMYNYIEANPETALVWFSKIEKSEGIRIR